MTGDPVALAQLWRRAVTRAGDCTFLVWEGVRRPLHVVDLRRVRPRRRLCRRQPGRPGDQTGCHGPPLPRELPRLRHGLAIVRLARCTTGSQRPAGGGWRAAGSHFPHGRVDRLRAPERDARRLRDGTRRPAAPRRRGRRRARVPLHQRPRGRMAHDRPSLGRCCAVHVGTTSRPKGVLVTQANYAFAGESMAAAASLTGQERHIVALPLFHANTQYYSFCSAIAMGSSIALMPSFSASRFLEQAARHGATHASLFAAPLRMILARAAERPPDLRLRHIWFAQDLTPQHYAQVTELFGCLPRQLYGMTEAIAAVLTAHPLEAGPDVLGRPTLGCTVTILQSETGRPVGPGVVGEIHVRGRRRRRAVRWLPRRRADHRRGTRPRCLRHRRPCAPGRHRSLPLRRSAR